MDALFILAFVIFVMFATSREEKGWSNSSPSFNWSSGGSTIQTSSIGAYRSLALNSGNASYEDEAYKEYIELDNWGDTNLNITGWTLKNGKDKRTYASGDSLQQFSADVATIPQGTKLLRAQGGSAMGDIVLEPGERAIITTGYIGVNSPIQITSFKETSCTGYIEGLPEYAFTPTLSTSCPSPSREPGLANLDRDCQDYISGLSSCNTPEWSAKDSNGETCTTCIRGRRLSNQCAAFIKEHFSYQGCVAYHASDKDFSKKTWRIFLGRAWQMWSDKYETINIFDRAGNLVTGREY